MQLLGSGHGALPPPVAAVLQRQAVQARDVHHIFEEDLMKSTMISTCISSFTHPVILARPLRQLAGELAGMAWMGR